MDEIERIRLVWARATQGEWSVSPHGNTYALYAGRTNWQHGMRLFNLDDGDANASANREAIAAASEHVRTLLAALDEASARIVSWETAHGEMRAALQSNIAARTKERDEAKARAERAEAKLAKVAHIASDPTLVDYDARNEIAAVADPFERHVFEQERP